MKYTKYTFSWEMNGLVQDNKFVGIIPPELIEAIKSNNCILFVGSGLSAQVRRSNGKPLPTWKNLLAELHEWAVTKGINFWGNPDDIIHMINKGNLLMAAQELQDRIGSTSMSEFLSEVFRDTNIFPGDSHRTIPHIPFRAIMTTNYDTLIEGGYALESNGKIPSILTQKDLASRHSLFRKNEFFIFKLHGHIDRSETIVLGSKDYQTLLFNSTNYRQFLETLFSVYTVLFVGFGGSDPDLDNIIDRLSSIYSRTLDKHFILLPHGTMNRTEIRRLLIDKKLQVIEYDKDKVFAA